MQKVFIEGGFIRKLGDIEADAYCDHLLRLDPESRRYRFSGSIADETIRSFAATVHGPDVVVRGFFVDGVLRGAADLHIVRPLDLQLAEAAFSIERPWQNHSVGSALLERTLLCARNRGVKQVQVSCLPQNKRMRQLARKFGATLTFDHDAIIGTMENPDPAPISVMQEMLADGSSFAAAILTALNAPFNSLEKCRQRTARTTIMARQTVDAGPIFAVAALAGTAFGRASFSSTPGLLASGKLGADCIFGHPFLANG
jgi:RimJ/RimL family protein N-acetyltransferase